MKKQAHYLTIKITGESGQGINSIGEILTTALKKRGLYVFGYREYPSIIKGGVASYQIEITEEESSAVHQKVDILLSIGRFAMYEYLDSVKENGIIIHSLKNLYLDSKQKELVENSKISMHYCDFENVALKIGDRSIANVIMVALLWKALNLEETYLSDALKSRYSSKPQLLEMDLKAINLVFSGNLFDLTLDHLSQTLPICKGANYTNDDLTISGNHALALGALSAGMRAIYSYPMTPATSIFSYLAKTSGKTGILVKQAEDEITAVQMTLGSSFAGTRAMVVTSGGGFDLMTETLSLAGMSETPLVIVLAQRPGPSTGLPTWTSGADVEVALYGGHGEFPRAILAASDALSAYTVIQHAFNISEEYQIPVIVLTDKYIAESLYQVHKFDEDLPITRGLSNESNLTPSDRYKLTESGLSKRWLPGSSSATFKANSDEHTPDGSSTEDEFITRSMVTKRLQKLETLKATLPEPIYFGPESPEFCFVGWGSNKSVILEAIKHADTEKKIGYVHYENLWPLKTKIVSSLVKSGTKLIAMESNATAQLAKLLRLQIDNLHWHKTFLKFDGRPFYIEEVTKFIEELS